MEFESDEESYEEVEDPGMEHGGSNQPGHQADIKDMHYDEAFDVGDSGEEEVESNPSENSPGQQAQGSFHESGGSSGRSNEMMMHPNAFQQKNQENMSEEASEELNIKGAYNPAEYQNLAVSAEVKELFQYIQRYKPQQIELDTKLRPFVPDYIPSVGEVDAFLKIPRPDGAHEDLGLVTLDEPKLNQTDPALLELKLKPLIKRPGTGGAGAAVRSIENADKNPKKITTWISNIADAHRVKPPPTVNYSKNMPDIDTLMDVWPAEVEDAVNALELPGPDLEVDLGTYVRIVCAILDIPVHNLPNNKSLVESLHLLFTLYSNFKSNQHFKQDMEYQNREIINTPQY
ncbi:unnamed protein product [Blepharisma stoltei]|uniref:Intraflagellar transport protein 46 homolog n=1 Tax=Blepharisma stoltei TaxID=1481888 RepID=A0AAU9IFS1_9CILI|nr:unnamed protein product [Blepharisma stoltei]